MTLQFQKKYKGKETFFVEKIRNGLFEKGFLKDIFYIPKKDNSGEFFKGKFHTIRNINTKFKIGTKIHFKQWSGRPYHSLNIDFAPILKVNTIQNISIKQWLACDYYTCFQMPNKSIYTVEIDGIRMTKEKIKQIAINDGFDNEIDFFNYFKRFDGKLIHWTDIIY